MTCRHCDYLASEASEPDAIAEALMRDISAALDKRPTLI